MYFLTNYIMFYALINHYILLHLLHKKWANLNFWNTSMNSHEPELFEMKSAKRGGPAKRVTRHATSFKVK